MKVKYFNSVIIAFMAITSTLNVNASEIENNNSPQTPTSIAVGADFYLITSRNHNAMYVYDKATNVLKSEIKLDMPATGVKIDGNTAYVTSSYDKGQLSKVDITTGNIEKSVSAGMGAMYPILSSDNTKVYVCNQFKGTVQAFNTSDLSLAGEVAVLREPCAAALTQDGKYLYVNNHLPLQRADLDYVAADVSVIDLTTMTKVKDIKLDNGSNALRDMVLSVDGKYIFVTHNLGRFQVPTSQLQQGWMNTSAVSVIDVATQTFLGSVLFDEPERGAAGIWGIDVDGNDIIVSHSGTHDISILKYDAFKEKFENTADRTKLSYDLYFLYGMRTRLPLVGNGPRDVEIENGVVYVPTYFSDTLNVVDIASKQIKTTAALHPSRVQTDSDKGEMYFNDATYCFQNWQSCNGCHPGDARTDGMNWDLVNDGIGNSKNCKSMVLSHVTAPSMISGVRETAELAVRKGFTHIQFAQVPNHVPACVDEYLKALKPLPSPYLVDGELSENAKAGRKVFEKYKCDACHSGPYYTDLQMYRIGEDVEFEKGWDTPTLIEVWRTAPYLFDGRATTIEEVFGVHKHGIDGKISKKDLSALSEYVKSL